MRDLKNRVAYLQGLAQGLDDREDPRKTQVISGIIEVLEELTDSLAEVQAYVDEIEDDLTQLEDDVYEYVEEDGLTLDESAEEEFIEVQCPRCDERVYFERAMVEEEDSIEVTCPTCDAVVFVSDETVDAQTTDDQFNGRWGDFLNKDNYTRGGRSSTKDI